MANITIFPETTRSDFGLDDQFGFCVLVTQNVAELEIGKVYVVVWDGTSYDCVGIDASGVMPNTVAIGNLAGFGGYGQGEPFAIAYMWQTNGSEKGEAYIVSALTDSSTTHTFAIYEKEQDETETDTELELILPTVSTDQFSVDSATGVYMCYIPQAPCVLEMGNTYTVIWDDVTYENLVAQDVSAVANASNSVAIGNISPMGGMGNNEPFAIMYIGEQNSACLYSVTNGTHSVSIYKEIASNPDPEEPEEPEEPEPTGEPEIVLKDLNGNIMKFSGVEKVSLNNTEGDAVIFSKGEALDNVEVELDFTNGDQIVEAPQGYLVKSATILKPINLMPKNIAEGVDIAGIVGTLVAGGGAGIDGDIVTARGSYTPSGTGKVTVNHNMGVIPDIITVYANYAIGGTNAQFNFLQGFNPEITPNQPCVAYISSAIQNFTMTQDMYGELTNLFGGIHSATPKSFSVMGDSGLLHATGKTYYWNAIGGLMKHAYFYITLALDGRGNLIVSGGVPEISQLKIFVGGTLAKTVDYVHGDTFVTDISDVAGNYQSYTISVEAVGATLNDKYPKHFYESVTGYTVPRNGSCGTNAKWYLYQTGELVIAGSGDMANYTSASSQPWYSWVSSVKKIVIEEGITSIGNYAFRSMTKVESVTIADSVTTIGSNAFRDCSALKSLSISANVKTINSYAFANTPITSVTFPETVVSGAVYSNDVFASCASLTSIVIPEGVTSIGNGIFNGCKALASVSLPSTLTTMGNHIFCNCTSLKTVTIPANVNSIGQYTCQGASALTSLIFENPNGWKRGTSTTSISTSVSATYMGNPSTAATYFKSTYLTSYWRRS